jgi:hypothetical protein
MEKRSAPHKDFRFWYYSPEGEGMTFFRTAENRDEYARKDMSGYLDGEWAEEVEWCCAGEMTHLAQQTDRKDRPTDQEELEEENWPEGIDYQCNYALLPLGANV